MTYLLNRRKAFRGGSYLLDDYIANAVGLYSRAKVTSDAIYSGALERMRVNTGGQPEYDNVVDGAGAFVDTAAIATNIGSNSAFLRTRYDQSGNGRHMSMTTVAQQFEIAAAGSQHYLNGLPIAYQGAGTPTGLGMAATATLSTNGATVFFVLAHNNQTFDLWMSANSLSMYGYRAGGTTNWNVNVGGTGFAKVNARATNTLTLVTAILNGSASSLRFNGVSAGTGVLSTNTLTRIDEGWQAGSGQIYKYCESLWFSTIFATPDLDAIEADIMSRWLIT